MAGSAELHEPAVVHHAFDDGRRELVVGEDRAPSAELDVGGEYHVPPLMAVRYDLVQEPRPVHVEGHVAELVQDQEPRLGRVGEQPVERPLPLGLAELQHQLRDLPEPHKVARRGRGDPEGGGHVDLTAPRLAVEGQVLRVAHERQLGHLVAAPAVGERDVGPVEALDRHVNGEPCLPGQARPLRPVAVRDLRPELRRARGHLALRRGGEMPGESVFVGSQEIIYLPNTLAARVMLRNSRIRQV